VTGVVVVLGGAACLWADVAALRTLTDPVRCTIVAVNDAGFLWPGRLDHWATLHPEELRWRAMRRQARGYPGGWRTWTCPAPLGPNDYMLAGWGKGSSGLLGVGVAYEGLGLRRIVLCGVPMDGQGHAGRPTGGWAAWSSHRAAWLEKPELSGVVRSLSGWTREVFGAPTAEWLTEGGPLLSLQADVR
jgi:hypothetical protein